MTARVNVCATAHRVGISAPCFTTALLLLYCFTGACFTGVDRESKRVRHSTQSWHACGI
jgi:hypothetical protein